MDERSFLLPGYDNEASRSFRTRYTSFGSRSCSAQKTPQPRLRIVSTQSGLLVSQLEESVFSTVSTSYGPVLVQTSVRPGLKRDKVQIMLGLGLALLSAVLFAANHFLFQYRVMNTTDMMVTRGALQALCLGLLTLATARCSAFKLSSGMDAVLVLSQGIMNGFRVGFTFSCLKFLAVGDALTIILTEPIWTLFLAKIFLKTPIGLWKFGFSCSLFVGATLCTQPPLFFAKSESVQFEGSNNSSKDGLFKQEVKMSDNDTVIRDNQYFDESQFYTGLLLALGASVFGAIANILVSKCSSHSSLLLTFWSGIGGALVAILYGHFYDTEDQVMTDPGAIPLPDFITLIILAGLGLLGFLLLTRALHLLPPTTVSVIRVTEIIFAYALQSIFMDKVPNTLAIVGSTLVILSVIGVSAENIFLSKFHNTSIYPTNL